MSRKNEKFKERMRRRQARAERLYRFALMSVALGVGLAWPRSPNPETEAMERAARSKQPPQDPNPKPPTRPDTGNKMPAGTQGARPRDGL